VKAIAASNASSMHGKFNEMNISPNILVTTMTAID
jgi:hypothetical protein